MAILLEFHFYESMITCQAFRFGDITLFTGELLGKNSITTLLAFPY
jgi:hypothetical protein